MQEKQIHIADTNHETILLSDIEKEVISTKLFNRLHHISQNSTIYLTFPSNKTKRFEHSIGTMKLCGDIFYSAVCNTAAKDLDKLLNKVKQFILEEIIAKEILADEDPSKLELHRQVLGEPYFDEKIDILKNFYQLKLVNVFYNMHFPLNIKAKYSYIYVLIFQAVRLCGLLHDIGHPPFSHVVEASMKKIYKELKKKSKLTPKEKIYLEILNTYQRDTKEFQLHESMGNVMVKRLKHALLFSEYSIFKDCSYGFEEKYFRILVFSLVEKIFEDKNLKFLHTIISGTIDGDRLDYVNRDIANSGLRSGNVEYKRLISSCKFVAMKTKENKPEDNTPGKEYSKKKDTIEYVLAFYIKTVNTIEDFFLKRWFLYKNIIYHHRVSKTDKLMQSCIEDLIYEYFANDKESKEAFDNTHLLPDNISGLWKAIKLSYSDQKYSDYLIQWDDNWLLTILKRHYFKDHYHTENTTAYKLEELLSNKKHYYSLIKNNADFSIFSEAFKDFFKKNCSNIYTDYAEKKKAYPVIYQNASGFFIFLKVYAQWLTDSINEIIEASLSPFIKETYKEKIKDALLIIRELKDGLDLQPFVYTQKGTFALSQFSHVKTVLDMEKNNYPFFYIYIKFSQGIEEKSELKNIRESFLKAFAEYTAKNISKRISEHMKQELKRSGRVV